MKSFISMVLLIKRGGGLLNKLINKLPFEVHIPGYRYCGPGTKLEQRLARNEEGVNPLDNYCKDHDIAYAQNKDLRSRHEADKLLTERAWTRVSAPDAKVGERVAAYAVTNAMKTKLKLGAGMNNSKHNKSKNNVKGKVKNKKPKITKKNNKKPRKHLRDAILAAKNIINKSKSSDLKTLVPVALKAARKAFKGNVKENIKKPRIIPIPKSGGALPFLLPLFAGLSAIGSLAGGATSVYKAINEVQKAKKENMNNVKIQKGKGLYLRPYKQGMGIFLEQTL